MANAASKRATSCTQQLTPPGIIATSTGDTNRFVSFSSNHSIVIRRETAGELEKQGVLEYTNRNSGRATHQTVRFSWSPQTRWVGRRHSPHTPTAHYQHLALWWSMHAPLSGSCVLAGNKKNRDEQVTTADQRAERNTDAFRTVPCMRLENVEKSNAGATES